MTEGQVSLSHYSNLRHCLLRSSHLLTFFCRKGGYNVFPTSRGLVPLSLLHLLSCRILPKTNGRGINLQRTGNLNARLDTYHLEEPSDTFCSHRTPESCDSEDITRLLCLCRVLLRDILLMMDQLEEKAEGRLDHNHFRSRGKKTGI